MVTYREAHVHKVLVALLQQGSKSQHLYKTLLAVNDNMTSHMHWHATMVVRSLLSWEASNETCQVVQTGNVCGCAPVGANHRWGGSEICLISHQLSGQAVEAFSFYRSQAAPLHGLPFIAGNLDAHPRMLAEAESWEFHESKPEMKHGGQFKPPALGICADSCSPSFWNHQLKPGFFFPSRAEKRMEFPFRETLLRALLGNGMNFHKVFSPKTEMSVSTSSNYITILLHQTTSLISILSLSKSL